MEIRKVSTSDLFGWLIGSFKLVGAHWGKFMLASLVSLLAILLLAVVLGLIMASVVGADAAGAGAAAADWRKMAVMYAVIIALAVLLTPPFIAGWFTLCRKLAHGQDASVGDLFAGYGDGARWKKLVAFGLMGTVLYIAVHGVYLLLCGALGVGSDELGTFLSAQSGNDPQALSGLSGAFWLAYAGIILIGMFLQAMFMLGFSEAALTDTGATDALKAGIAGTLKNLLSLLLFMLAFLVAVIAVALVIGVLAALVIGVLSFLSKSAAVAIGAALYIIILLMIYPLMFSFQYFLWRGILGRDGAEPAFSASEVML